jgi:hypothetical protein
MSLAFRSANEFDEPVTAFQKLRFPQSWESGWPTGRIRANVWWEISGVVATERTNTLRGGSQKQMAD